MAQTVTDDFELGDSTAPPLGGTGDIDSLSTIAGPDWSELFNADGSHKDAVDALGVAPGNGIPDFIDLYQGHDALFIGDDISVGSNTDLTIRYGSGNVETGLVGGQTDLGNAYVYVANNAAGERVLYAGLERMSTEAVTVEMEFNQGLFRLGHGWPGVTGWEIVGAQTAKDMRLTIDIAAGGTLGAVGVDSWEDPESDGTFTWTRKLTLGAEGCNAADAQAVPPIDADTLCGFRNDLVVAGGEWPSYDASGNPVTEIEADCFYEVGINVGKLLGVTDPAYDYTTVQLRTTDDLAFGYFGEGN
ncbi:MAG: hypothetical protein OER88_12130 [Planctomycetota bacterium]|nr:hypothetical protein [Planctomycetota bacterium]